MVMIGEREQQSPLDRLLLGFSSLSFERVAGEPRASPTGARKSTGSPATPPKTSVQSTVAHATGSTARQLAIEDAFNECSGRVLTDCEEG